MGSSLSVQPGTAGATGDDSRQISATWTFRSTEVDVDIALTTTEGSEACSTTGELILDKALSPTESYVLERTDCGTLRLTDHGDIVLYGLATRYNWSDAQLVVDTDRETIELGPCTPAGSTVPVLFRLSAPDCGGSCTCAQLTRHWEDRDAALPLGKKCE